MTPSAVARLQRKEKPGKAREAPWMVLWSCPHPRLSSMIYKSLAQIVLKSRQWLVTLATRVNKQYLARDVMRPAYPLLLIGWWSYLQINKILTPHTLIVNEGSSTMDIGRTMLQSYLPCHRLDAGTFGCGVWLYYSSCYCDGERLQCWRERSKVTATSCVYTRGQCVWVLRNGVWDSLPVRNSSDWKSTNFYRDKIDSVSMSNFQFLGYSIHETQKQWKLALHKMFYGHGSAQLHSHMLQWWSVDM